MRGYLRYLAVLCLGIVIGFPFGYRRSEHTVTVGVRELSQLMASAMYGNLAWYQMAQADNVHAKEALVDYLKYLQLLESSDVPHPDEKVIQSDFLLSYTRLAALERAAGNQESSKVYIEKAKKAFEARWGQPDAKDTIQRQVDFILTKSGWASVSQKPQFAFREK